MEAERQLQIHVVMLPWLAQGHINPFFNLSRTLVSHGAIRVSLVSTPLNISRMRSRLRGEPIELIELTLSSVEGLPPGAECTADIKPESAHLLHAAFDQSEERFEALVRRLSPDFLVHDIVAPWAATVAAHLKIPSLPFSVYSPAAFSYVLGQAMHGGSRNKTVEDLSRPALGYPSEVVSWRLSEARLVSWSIANYGDGIWECCEQSCGILIKSCFEEEDKYLQYVRDITGKLLLSVGPLMLSATVNEDESGTHILRWLDKQQPSSVVFVSFGSESYLSGEQIKEMALALEDTGAPFLWSLRVPQDSGSGSGGATSLLLPQGFEARTSGRGMVVDGWIPQQRIVSHTSVGCYVTHGGWSSVMEAWLYKGLPLVLIPLRHDQGLNCRQIAGELKAGIEVERGSEDGSFSREKVSEAVRRVMGDEEIRSRVGELGGVLRHKSQHQESYITGIVHQMLAWMDVLKLRAPQHA